MSKQLNEHFSKFEQTREQLTESVIRTDAQAGLKEQNLNENYLPVTDEEIDILKDLVGNINDRVEEIRKLLHKKALYSKEGQIYKKWAKQTGDNLIRAFDLAITLGNKS